MPEKTLSEVFGDIANAIREKTESQETMTPLEMADEIANIPTGIELESNQLYVTDDNAEIQLTYPITESQSAMTWYNSDAEEWDAIQLIVSKESESAPFKEAGVYECLNGSSGYEFTAIYDGDLTTDEYYIYNHDYSGCLEHVSFQFDALYCYCGSSGMPQINLNSGSTYTYEGGSVFEPYSPDFESVLDDYMAEQYEELGDAQRVPWLYSVGSGLDDVDLGTWVVGLDTETWGMMLYDYNFANNTLYWVGSVGSHEYAEDDITELQLNSGSTYTYNGDGEFEPYQAPDPAQENALYYGNEYGGYTGFSGFFYEGTGLYQLNSDTSGRHIVLDAVGDSQIVELNEEHYKVIRID